MRLVRPAILWRFISREFWKLLLLTGSVLVVVIAFAITIKPLADGLIGPADAVRFMLMASVPMMQYALPFAALFAATLVYHRMAQDNEVVATSAGGIAYRTMLVPAAVSGLILAIFVGLLADQAMPRLLRAMQELVAQDASRLISSSVGRGQAIRLGDRLLYADTFNRLEPEPGSRAFQRFLLSGVLAVELDSDGKPTWEASARFAEVWLYRESTAVRGQGQTAIVMRLRDSVGGREQRGLSQVEETSIVYRIPSTFTDDPKYLSLGEMLATLEEPERLNIIDSSRRVLAQRIAEREAFDAWRRTLDRDGRLTLRDAGNRLIVVRAAGLAAAPDGDAGFILTPGTRGGPVEVSVITEDSRTRTHRAERAFLTLPIMPDASRSLASVLMENVRTTGASPALSEALGQPAEQEPTRGMGGIVSRYAVTNLVPSPDPLPELLAERSSVLLAKGRAKLSSGTSTADDAPLRSTIDSLQAQIDDARREILSKAHERLAASLTCGVMVVLGAVLGMRLRDSLPLAVYLWAFLPALVCVLSISGGQRMVHTYGLAGLPVLYAGVIGLSLFCFYQYRILARR